jgi:hypothetical protein
MLPGVLELQACHTIPCPMILIFFFWIRMKYKFEESFTQALALDTVVYEGMFFESPNVWDKKLEEALDFSI